MRTIYVNRGPEFGLFKGDGSSRYPFIVSTAGDVDRIFLHGAFNPDEPVRYVFGAGVFPFSGSWAMERAGYAHLHPGDQLIGAGIGVTRFELTNPVMVTQGKSRPDVHCISIGKHEGGSMSLPVVVKDLTIDGNFEAHGPNVFVTSGLRVYQGTAMIENVEVMGLRGSLTQVRMPDGKIIPLEAFGISMQTGNGHSVRNCIVAKCASNSYLSAFSSCAGSHLFPNRFTDCTAAGGVGNHAAFTVYSHTQIAGGHGAGFQHGIYNDTERIEAVFVRRSQLWSSRVGVGLVAVGQDEVKSDITIDQCRFGFESSDEPMIGLEMYDKRKVRVAPAFLDIRMLNCQFAHVGDPRPFYLATGNGPIAGVLMRHLSVPEKTIVNFRGTPSEYLIDWIRSGLKSAIVTHVDGSQ